MRRYTAPTLHTVFTHAAPFKRTRCKTPNRLAFLGRTLCRTVTVVQDSDVGARHSSDE